MVSYAQEGMPLPGTINCAEGQVTVDGQTVGTDRSAVSEVPAGHSLQTQQGRAEVLLTPGVFLRVAENSAVKMERASERDVKVELVRGEAMVEVAHVDKRRPVDVIDNGINARLDHDGLYLFNAGHPAVLVYRGKTRVNDDRRVLSVNQGEELLLGGAGAMKRQKFDVSETDSIYEWSRQRADYEAGVSEWTTEGLLALGSSSSYAAGWHWNRWYRSWAFVPEKGYEVSPFGYGFYAPGTPHDRTPIFGDFR
jgi:hypothetical protein